MRLSALGDVVCGLPAATVIRRAVPDSEITWAVDSRFEGIVQCCDAVDHVARVAPGHGLRNFRVTGQFDAVLDLQGLLKSSLVGRLTRAKRRYGYHWQRESAALLIPKVRPAAESLHIVEQVADVARVAVGTDDSAIDFALRPQSADCVALRQRLADVGADPERFVVMNAGAGWATKRWPAASFAFVAREVAERGWSPVFVGGRAASDQAAFEEVRRAGADAALSLVGQTTVRELVALISMAGAHLGGDTGSSHITAAVGRPAIGLYSITNPIRSCPYGQLHRCHYDPVALDRIAPEDVLKTLFEALGYTARHAISGPHGSNDA